MEYKRTTFVGSIFWGNDAIAKNWTLVEENVNSVIKVWTFFLNYYPLLVGYSL